jgi:hypothetical protein
VRYAIYWIEVHNRLEAEYPQSLGRRVLAGAEHNRRGESNYHIVALAFEYRPIRHRQQLLGLFASEPVAQPNSLLPHIGDIGEVGGLFKPLRLASPTSFRIADNRTLIVDEERCSIVVRYSMRRARERSVGTEGKQIVEGRGIVALGVDGLYRV